MDEPKQNTINRMITRIALLCFAVPISLAGIRWLQDDLARLDLLGSSPDGKRFISQSHVEGNYRVSSTQVRDSSSGEVEVDLSPFDFIDWPMVWSPDGKSVAGISETTTRAHRFISVRLDPAPRKVDEMPITPEERTRHTFLDNQGRLIPVKHRQTHDTIKSSAMRMAYEPGSLTSA